MENKLLSKQRYFWLENLYAIYRLVFKEEQSRHQGFFNGLKLPPPSSFQKKRIEKSLVIIWMYCLMSYM